MIKKLARWILRHEINGMEMIMQAMMNGIGEHGLCLLIADKEFVEAEDIKIVPIDEAEEDE